jgi:hypothetical protein
MIIGGEATWAEFMTLKGRPVKIIRRGIISNINGREISIITTDRKEIKKDINELKTIRQKE